MGDDQDNQGDDDQQYSPGDDNENWVDSEAGIDLYFVIFLTLLAVVLTCAKFLRDRPRIAAILPEAGMIIVVGALSGALLSFAMLPLSRGDAAEDDDGENDNRKKFVAEGLLSFSPKVFFFVLLPPIIFNSGYCLKHEVFFRHITPISLFACAGTAISTFAIAAILELLKSCGLLGEFAPKFTELMTFGALISATDPVSTLAVFQAKKVDPHLFYLVFGESVLNDAVGLVLFKTTSKLVGNEDSIEKVLDVVLEFLVDFTLGFGGSMIMGFMAGLTIAFFLKTVDMRKSPSLELGLYVLIMYLPFFSAELFGLSGIVTILFTGISARRYAKHNLSDSTEETALQLFHLVAHLAETAIFLEVGLCFVSFVQNFYANWKFAAWAMVACLIGRALNIYPLRMMYNQSLRWKELTEHLNEAFAVEALSETAGTTALGLHKQSTVSMGDTLTPKKRRDLTIRDNTAHMLWFSGLRGAVAYACAKEFPDAFGNRSAFVFATMFIVLFTVFVFGCSTELALNTLGIETNVDEEKYMDVNGTVDKMNFWASVERKHIYPRVIRDYNEASFGNIELKHVTEDGKSWYQPSTLSASTDEINNSLEPKRQPNNFDAKTAFHAKQLVNRSYLSKPLSPGRTRKNSSIYDFGHSMTVPARTSTPYRAGGLLEDANNVS